MHFFIFSWVFNSVFGNNLISKRELKRLKNKHKEELNINEEEMLLIKEFLENFENK